MAKFRTNHGSGRGRGGGRNYSKSIVLVLIVFGMLYVSFLMLKKNYFGFDVGSSSDWKYELPISTEGSEERLYIPDGGKGQLIHHRYYSLSYLDEFELAEWVSYELTKESLIIRNVERTNWFNEDYKVEGGSANYYDYKGSGYNRGHLAPAGDMAFNKTAMEESFLMSNIAPQTKRFNNGIWKELEENIRDWAYKNDRLFVTTGPVVSFGILKRIGRNRVAAPKYFYKVLLDLNDPDLKAIGFIIENKKSERHLREYAVTVDSVESLTGLNFFGNMMSEKLENQLESNYDISKWPISEKRFIRRLNQWNKQ